MNSETSLTACETFTVRHFNGLGAIFLAAMLLAAGFGVVRGWQADNAEQLFGHVSVTALPNKG